MEKEYTTREKNHLIKKKESTKKNFSNYDTYQFLKEKEYEINQKNTLIKRKESARKTFSIIGFPEDLIDDEAYNTMIKIKFENMSYINNQDSIFKNFSKNNEADRKFDYNLLKENINFNIKPLFEKYHISLKKEKISEIFNGEHISSLKIYFLLIKIIGLISKNSFLAAIYNNFFTNICIYYYEFLSNLFYFKMVYAAFGNYNNCKVIETFYINKEDFRNCIFDYLNNYKKLFTQKLSKKSFILSPEVITFDSINLLYFSTLMSIYYNFLKKDIDTSEIDILVENFKEKKSNFNIKYSTKEELVYKCFYFYQSFKVYKDSVSLTKDKDEDLDFYNQNLKKTYNHSYRTEGNSLLNKKEFMKILNEKDEKNFKNNIDKFENFIDNFFNRKDIKEHTKMDLDTYSIFYQELFHNRRKGEKNFITIFKNEKNIHQSDFYFVYKKLMRSFIINNMSKEKYNKFTSFIENIANIYLNNLYDENASVLFDLIEKSLDLHIKLNFNNEFKKIELLLDDIPLNPNIYTTKHKK